MNSFAGLLPLVLLMFTRVAEARDYSAASIPDSLKENAHAVIREFQTEIALETVNSGIKRVKKAVTVLDKNGDENAILMFFYDKNSKPDLRELNIYDKNGQRIKKVKTSEITDFPADNEAILYTDNRIIYYRPSYPEYPYTVEYEYEIKSSNLICYESWFPVNGYQVAVEHSGLTFIHPPEIPFRKKEFLIALKSSGNNKAGKLIETWECNYSRAIEEEPFDINPKEHVPGVYLMPVRLIYDNHNGTAGNWKEYGAWVNNLFMGRDDLDEREKTKVAEILGDTLDTVQKIKRLYEYMQERTRYVNISLGIGGFQPFPARTVFETGYGDCKALSNYMHALLRQAGIRSYPALVASGKYIETIFPDFPNFYQFDHMILCVPLPEDTIWLECTSQDLPFGFLGEFTDDRQALLITGEGGIFAHTKKYPAMDNTRLCTAIFKIDGAGSADCSIQTRYKGLQYDKVAELLAIKPDEQRKWLCKNSTLPSLQLDKYSINNDQRSIPSVIVEESLTSKNYCSFTGNYMLLPLNRINFQKPIQKMLRERHSDILIQRSLVEYDTLVYRIPDNYRIEAVPEGKTIKSDFGEYSFTAEAKGNTLIYTRIFRQFQGRYSALKYKEFYEYYLAVSKADNEKVMLIKN